MLEGGNGPMTGKCVLPDDGGGGNQSYCQITAWCPTQIEDKAVTYVTIDLILLNT